MDKPQKPTNLLPRSFGGQKEAFDADKIANGYQPDVPDILGGANLNYTLDTMGKELEYTEKIADFVNGLPIGNIITTDDNNKLVYVNSASLGGANTSLTNLTVDGETHFDNKYIQKSGDTMTGTLTINTNKSTLLEEALSDYTSPSAQDTLKTLFRCKSSNNKTLCALDYYQEGETRGLDLSVRNSKQDIGTLALKIDETGNAYATAPNPAEDSDTNNIATTSWVNSKIPTEGDKYFLAKNRITNCLLEVPQRIKYTLEEHFLTINAGTVVIVPYGTVNLTSTYPVGSTFIKDQFKVYDTQYSGGKFFVWVELQEDIPLVIPSSVTNPFEDGVILGLDDNGGNVFWGNTSVYNIVNGNTQPTPTTNIIWYDTANNRIKMYRTLTSAWQDTDLGGMPLPFTFLFFSCSSYNTTSGQLIKVSSVNKVLNGMGYFGGLYWIDKGVKFLIPNGRNSDGTLNNIEYKRTILYTGLQPATNRLVVSGENGTTPIIRSNYFISDTTPQYYGMETNRWFNPKENKMYKYDQNMTGNWVQVFDTPIAEYDTDGTSITSFKAYEPVQLENKIETWESEWFTSPGASKSVSFNLAGTGMNATNAPHIFMEMIGKVIDATSNYKVGDIVYPQFTNYNGSTGNKEEGQSVYFSGNTLTYAQGNSDSWVGIGANGGHGTLRVSDVQIKIILRRFNN